MRRSESTSFHPTSSATPRRRRVIPSGSPLGCASTRQERQLIELTLEHTGRNKTRAAEMLGISAKTLHNKLNRLSGRTEGHAAGRLPRLELLARGVTGSTNEAQSPLAPGRDGDDARRLLDGDSGVSEPGVAGAPQSRGEP